MGRRRNLSDERWRPRAAVLAIGVVGIGAAFAPAGAIARGLPDGRAYEMVSAIDKNGGDATSVLTSSPDGNRLAYYSMVGFAGADATSVVNSYAAVRGPSGWSTVAMQPKIGAPNLAVTGGYHIADFTDDLSESITLARSAAAEPAVQNIFTTRLDRSSTWVSAPAITPPQVGDKSYAGRSADGSHIIFESSQQFSDQVTIPTGSPQVWEWVNGAVRLVSILPDGSLPTTGAGTGNGANGGLGVGTGFPGTLPQPNVVSDDGSKIFFGIGGGVAIGGDQAGVYVREDGARTRELDLSQRSGVTFGQPPALGSSFAGASSDGNVAVFISQDQLTNDATPHGGLYAFDLRTGVLRFLSSGATDPNGAQIEAIVGNGDAASLVSRDGSHVYFIAQGVLVPGKGVAGGHNLYVADADGVSFIATLGNDDTQNWLASAGNGGSTTMRTTPNGRYVVFQSWERLTSVDNNGHEEVYLYDAAKDTTTCVSCGDAGHAPAGDASILSNPVPRGGFLTSSQLGRQRALTDDGSRLYFQTTDGLLPEDTNGLEDVYEYYTATGKVALISAGTGGYDSEIADNSPDGRDVFFFTRDSLVKRDIDGGGRDVYDARVGGGFADPNDVTPCADDACQPIPHTAPAAPAPLTGVPVSGGTKETRAPKLFVRRITDTGRKNVIKTGRLTLVTTVESSGTISASGTAAYGDHKVYKLKSAKVTIKKAGTKNLHVSLPSAVRSQLKHHHKVKLSITVSYNKATAPVHVALTLS